MINKAIMQVNNKLQIFSYKNLKYKYVSKAHNIKLRNKIILITKYKITIQNNNYLNDFMPMFHKHSKQTNFLCIKIMSRLIIMINL